MERNLDRRVEAVVPVQDPQLCIRLEWLLQLYLDDNSSAWEMASDGTYRRAEPMGGCDERRSQDELMELWSLNAAQA